MSQQFVVQLPNRPGELAHLAKGPVAHGRQHRPGPPEHRGDLTCAEIYTDCCDDDTKGSAPQHGLPLRGRVEPGHQIEDTPCALGEVSDRLSHAGVNIEGCCVLSRANGLATWALSVDGRKWPARSWGCPRPSGARSRPAGPQGAVGLSRRSARRSRSECRRRMREGRSVPGPVAVTHPTTADRPVCLSVTRASLSLKTDSVDPS